MSSERAYPAWVRCEDEIPRQEVICCDEDGNMMIGYIDYACYSKNSYVAENNCEFMYNVVKWMPLPEP